jgi:hypothetical protein
MLNSLRKHFVPNKVVLLRPSDQEEPDIIRLAKFTEYQSSFDGKPLHMYVLTTHARCRQQILKKCLNCLMYLLSKKFEVK